MGKRSESRSAGDSSHAPGPVCRTSRSARSIPLVGEPRVMESARFTARRCGTTVVARGLGLVADRKVVFGARRTASLSPILPCRDRPGTPPHCARRGRGRPSYAAAVALGVVAPAGRVRPSMNTDQRPEQSDHVAEHAAVLACGRRHSAIGRSARSGPPSRPSEAATSTRRCSTPITSATRSLRVVRAHRSQLADPARYSASPRYPHPTRRRHWSGFPFARTPTSQLELVCREADRLDRAVGACRSTG